MTNKRDISYSKLSHRGGTSHRSHNGTTRSNIVSNCVNNKSAVNIKKKPVNKKHEEFRKNGKSLEEHEKMLEEVNIGSLKKRKDTLENGVSTVGTAQVVEDACKKTMGSTTNPLYSFWPTVQQDEIRAQTNQHVRNEMSNVKEEACEVLQNLMNEYHLKKGGRLIESGNNDATIVKGKNRFSIKHNWDC